MLRLNDIVERVQATSAEADVELIQKAYVFTAKVHHGQLRESGEPYLIHPLNVAYILADWNMDEETVVTGLLHDTVEDTVASREEIEELFGPTVAQMVDGVTKISRVVLSDVADQKAESLRKMILAMGRDIRVILVKLADRIHNMRTIAHLSPDRQAAIAHETQEIYAPIASRLGMSRVKMELEDLCFQILHPADYRELSRAADERKRNREAHIQSVTALLEKKIGDAGLSAAVTGRSKNIAGIFNKMARQAIEFEQVYDLIGFRIIMKTVREVYEVLGIVHSLWRPVPGRFKDYIAMPKANLYQSLHTTVFGPNSEMMEIQIRTEEMHALAEYGVAAHWRYKEGKPSTDKGDQMFVWLRQILELQQEMKDPREFLNTVKVELFPDEVYVFTPRGDVKGLPRGATPIDFAYAIHTEVGNQCVGAKLNGRMVPLRTALKNGDVVEILTSSSHRPSKDWLKIAKTSRALNKIRAFVREEQQEHSLAVGRQILEREFRKYGISLNRALKAPEFLEILQENRFKGPDDYFVAVGYGKVSLVPLLRKLVPPDQLQERGKETRLGALIRKVMPRKPSAVIVKGVDDMFSRLANCCHPVPGDPIVGFITMGRGVSVHKADCVNLLSSDPKRWLDVSWTGIAEKSYKVGIHISAENKRGIFAEISGAISLDNANIVDIAAHTTPADLAEMTISLEVGHLEHLNTLMQHLRQLPAVITVRRL